MLVARVRLRPGMRASERRLRRGRRLDPGRERFTRRCSQSGWPTAPAPCPGRRGCRPLVAIPCGPDAQGCPRPAAGRQGSDHRRGKRGCHQRSRRDPRDLIFNDLEFALVTIADDNDAAGAFGNRIGLVLIAPSASDVVVQDKWADSTAPVLVMNAASLDEMGMTAAGPLGGRSNGRQGHSDGDLRPPSGRRSGRRGGCCRRRQAASVGRAHQHGRDRRDHPGERRACGRLRVRTGCRHGGKGRSKQKSRLLCFRAGDHLFQRRGPGEALLQTAILWAWLGR